METVMARMDTRGRRDQHRRAPRSRFAVALAIVAVAGIAFTVAIGAPTPPELSALIGP